MTTLESEIEDFFQRSPPAGKIDVHHLPSIKSSMALK